MEVSGIVKQKSKSQLKKEVATAYNEMYEQRDKYVKSLKSNDSAITHGGVEIDTPPVEMKELVVPEKKKVTPEEYAAHMGWSKIPKFPVNAKTYQLRKMFKQLTKQEMAEEVKLEKVNRGVEKIYSLLARACI